MKLRPRHKHTRMTSTFLKEHLRKTSSANIHRIEIQGFDLKLSDGWQQRDSSLFNSCALFHFCFDIFTFSFDLLEPFFEVNVKERNNEISNPK